MWDAQRAATYLPMGQLTHPKQVDNIVSQKWEFIGSTDVTDFVATTTGAGSAFAQISAHSGKVRLTTDANDNDRVEVNSDIGTLIMVNGLTRINFQWTAPSEVDNADFYIGFSTLDTDVIGDAATATELLMVGVSDMDAAAGSRYLKLVIKNGSGTHTITTDLVVAAGVTYNTNILVNQTSAGVGHVSVQHARADSAAFFSSENGVPLTYGYSALYLPTASLACFFGLQNGSAAARTMDIDTIEILQERFAS